VRVLVSGASGLVGTALCRALRARGDTVVALVRRDAGANERRWDPALRTVDPYALDGVDAVVNLAGENIGARRWDEAHKARVLRSRVDATATLVRAVLDAKAKPRVFLNASATGFYGATGTTRVDESAPNGTGFLAEVCRAWEGALAPLHGSSVRVVRARFGVVLAKDGGALDKMLLPFRMGLGGRVGDGAQGFPWVAIDDLVGGILHALDRDDIAGPLNITAPEPVSNAELTRALGAALRRPTVLPVPGFALRLLAGREMADELVLTGAYVLPRVLERTGYAFRYRRIEDALASYVGA